MPLITFLVISGIYLAVNAKVANAGREVLSLERRIGELERENAERVTRLAEMTTPARLMERALSLGFRPAEPTEVEYLVMEGYAGPPAFMAPVPAASTDESAASLSPAYTETLGDWLTRWLDGGVGSP